MVALLRSDKGVGGANVVAPLNWGSVKSSVVPLVADGASGVGCRETLG